MFTALYLKEWKDKSLVFLFELGILVLLLGAQFVLREKKDIREWLIYAVLMLFYPFAALVLGAAGFEAEYRKGAWAYLFSRPVRKSTVWLAKFAALLSMLAALWLVFVALWIAVPGIRELAGGSRVLLGFSVQSEFPWWSILQSGFLLTVAFSLSLLHERQFNILFVSLGVGFLLPAAAWAVMNTRAGGFLAWLSPERALPTLLVCQVLVALAFAAASILALARSDFSQPRKLTFGFARWFMPFLVLALAGTAAWTRLTPDKRERYLYLYASTSSGGETYYVTERGVFKYSAARDRIRWVVKAKMMDYFAASASAGRIAYTDFYIRSKHDIIGELWVANADGSGRKKILGRGSQENWSNEEDFMGGGLLISPDGAKVAILSHSVFSKPWGKRTPPLRIANTDGTRLESLPDDPALFETSADQRFYFHLVAWAPDGHAILIGKMGYGRPKALSLWLYDLGSRTARMVLDNAALASWRIPSPRGDLLTIKYQKSPEAPWRLALLDLKTLATSDISGSTADDQGQVSSQISWDPEGNRMAYLCRRKQARGPDAYVLIVHSLSEQKVLAERVMTKSEGAAQLYSPSWTADGGKIVVLDREANGLRILGPDLKEAERIAFPRRLDTPIDLQVVGDQALVGDNNTDSLWRCDLKKKSWKRLY